MTIQTNGILASLEEQYAIWTKEQEQTREIQCRHANIDFKIVLCRGYWIYPYANCPTPGIIENSVNVSSKDPRITALFMKYLTQINFNDNLYRFPEHEQKKSDQFRVRFFSNEELLRKQLLLDEREYAPLKEPRWGLKHTCNII